MEKYRSSADSSTGIHPFLPQTEPSSLVSKLLSPALFAIRFPLFVLSFAAYYVLSSTIRLIPIPLLYKATIRLCDKLILPVLAFSLGLWQLPLPTLERPRVRNVQSDRYPRARDLIYCNHSSPLDALYLAYSLSAAFAIPVDDYVVRISFLEAMFGVGCGPKSRPCPSSQEPFDASVPIVLFAEGCTTNAKGVLSFQKIRHYNAKEDNIYALGIMYSADGRETFTVGSVAWQMFKMMCATNCQISARLTAVPNDSSNVQATVASLAGIPALRIAMAEGAKFRDHWVKSNVPEKQ